MLMGSPVSIFKVFHELLVLTLRVEMSLCFNVVAGPVVHNFFLKLVNCTTYGLLCLFHPQIKVYPFLFELVLEKKSLLINLLLQSLMIKR